MMGISKFFFETHWGAKSVVALYISILSGIVLALQYDPTAPFYSTSSIDLLVPYGAFFRSLHFYSSQLFFLLSLLHFLVILIAKTESIPLDKWILLTATLPVVVLLLLTGYILRGDSTGEFAGVIAENIALSVPLFGVWLDGLLFSIVSEGMKRVYANHLISLMVLWLVLCWGHVRKYRIGLDQHGDVTFGLLIFCFMVNAPMKPATLGVFYVPGPWFLLGLQELLRYVHVFWAGIIFPLSLMIALSLASVKTRYRKPALIYAGCWLLLYTILSVIAILR